MRQADLLELEQLSRIDRLIERCQAWPATASVWEPAQSSRLFLQRVIPRVQSLRERLQAPLVVALFGGTGTGKSSLVNALLGREISPSGRQRPTTLKPQLLIHPLINVDLLELPLDQAELQRPNLPLLEDMIIVDCPDPDTTEQSDATSNLERLRRFLPHCDVLIYTSTQQKYRSASVQTELLSAAAGCKLVFVQTHADRDVDIRDDWKTQLSDRYEVPEMFFVDSVESLQRQQNGQPALGEMARLQQFLQTQLASSNRTSIRRDNVLDLLYASLIRAQQQLHSKAPAIETFRLELDRHTRQLQQQLSLGLQEDLLSARQLWERRLADSVIKRWGSTPFSWLLRLQSSLGTLLGSFGLMRARTTAHVALLGIAQGARMLKRHRQEKTFDSLVNELDEFTLTSADVAGQRIILQGYARTAGLAVTSQSENPASRTDVVGESFQAEFFEDARREVDQAVEQLAKRNSGPMVRFLYDFCFLLFPIFLLARIGKNFFWDSFLFNAEILAADFYIPAAIFLALWCGLFLMFFIRRLRRGLGAEVKQLVDRMLARKLQHNMFPDLQTECQAATAQLNSLDELVAECESLRHSEVHTSRLGAQKVDPTVSPEFESIP